MIQPAETFERNLSARVLALRESYVALLAARGSFTSAIKPAFKIVRPARRYKPACCEPKCSSAQTFRLGARNPPRLPIPITAIPPAAARSARYLVGNIQKSG